MEIVLVAVFLITVLLFVLQMFFFTHKWIEWVYLAVVGAGLYLAYPYSIEESYGTIRQTMSSSRVIGNLSALIIGEAVVGIIICLRYMKIKFDNRVSKWQRFLPNFVGITIFIALYYIETMLFINIRGIDYLILTVIIAVSVPIMVLLLKMVVKIAVPEEELRNDIKFFLHLIQIVFAIILSVVALKMPNTDLQYSWYLLEFFSISLIVSIVGFIGYFYYIIRNK